MATNTNTNTTPAAPVAAPVLPNRNCATHPATPYTIATPNGGKHWHRYCAAGNVAHAQATTHPLPVTTAARFLAGLSWPAYLAANGGNGGNVLARSNALAAIAAMPTAPKPAPTPKAPKA